MTRWDQAPRKQSSLRTLAEQLKILQVHLLEKAEKDRKQAEALTVQALKNPA